MVRKSIECHSKIMEIDSVPTQKHIPLIYDYRIVNDSTCLYLGKNVFAYVT